VNEVEQAARALTSDALKGLAIAGFGAIVALVAWLVYCGLTGWKNDAEQEPARPRLRRRR